MEIYTAGSAPIVLGTSASERMRIDSSGNVGIGVSNPSSYASNANNLVVGNTSSTNGITILTGTGNAGGINFADGTGGTDRGRLDYDHGDDRMRFYTASSERMRITSAGDVGIGATSVNSNYGTNVNIHSTATDGARLKISDGTSGNGNTDGLDIIHTGYVGYIIQRENAHLSISTNNTERLRVLAAGGLTFNGDTATANALNDYEEGTWTPTLNSSSGTGTHGAQSGTYTRIGRLVHCRCRIDLTAKNTLNSHLNIGGLPFTVANVDAGTSLDFGGFFHYYINVNSTIYFIGVSPVGGGTSASLYFQGTGSGMDTLKHSDIDSDFDFRATFSYYV